MSIEVDLMAEPLNTRAKQAIRAEMARRGVKQAELSLALGHSQTWLSWRVTGRTPLTLSDIEEIAGYLDIPIDTLLPTGERRQAS